MSLADHTVITNPLHPYRVPLSEHTRSMEVSDKSVVIFPGVCLFCQFTLWEMEGEEGNA